MFLYAKEGTLLASVQAEIGDDRLFAEAVLADTWDCTDPTMECCNGSCVYLGCC